MKGRAWLALLWLMQPAHASAEEPARRGPALNWVRLPGAEGCITASELAARVEERLERRVFVLAHEAELTFDGYVAPRALGGFEAHLGVSNARGEVLGSRELQSAERDCRALDDALVLITALTLFPGDFGMQSGGIALDAETNARLHALFGDEPSELDPASLPAPPPVAPERSEPVTTERADAVEDRRKPRSGGARAEILAAPVLAYGVLPGLAFGLHAELAIRLPGVFPMRVGLGHFFERDAPADRLASGVARFERSELTLFGCPIAPDAPLAFELCAGVALGIVSASSDGFEEGNIDARDPVVDIGGQGGLRLLIAGALVARLGLTALLPIVQRTYEYQALDAATEPVFRSAQAGVRLQLGLGAEF